MEVAVSLEDDVRMLVERQAIVDVLHRYCYLADIQDHERLVREVYAVNGSDDHGGGPIVGRDAIKEWFDEAVLNIAACYHNVSNVVVDIDGEHAHMVSNLVSWTWTRENSVDELGPRRPADYSLAVRYADDLTKYPGEGWRIDRRVLVANGVSVIAVGEMPSSQRGIQALASKI
jgi:SnoaL-like domain